MSLLSLPVEINAMIFQLASLDADQTAHSLCLTSKYCRAIAHPLLFQSISVYGLSQMRGLARHLEQSPHIPQTMRYLLISERLEIQEYIGERSIVKAQVYKAMALEDVAERIVPLVAPFLETLSYMCYQAQSEERIAILYSSTWPHLVELTLRGDLDSLRLPSGFPALERFHIYALESCFEGIEEDVTPIHLDRSCPRLTHLKASGFGAYDAQILVKMLKEAWGIVDLETAPNGSEENTLPRLHLPSQLRCIIFRPDILTHTYGIARAYHERMVNSIVSLAEVEQGRGLVVELEIEERSHYLQERRDWLDRLNGGNGCWPN